MNLNKRSSSGIKKISRGHIFIILNFKIGLYDLDFNHVHFLIALLGGCNMCVACNIVELFC